MKVKHTPGPWHQLTAGFSRYHISRSVGPNWSSKDNLVGDVRCRNGIADANLIAAAPELLEAAQITLAALERFFENTKDLDTEGPGYSLIILRSAIAKAEGRSSHED